jgi:hypothetical protein
VMSLSPGSPSTSSRTFFLTFSANNPIYESHCEFFGIAKSSVRENQPMKSATKKAAKKAPAKKAKKGK